MKTLCKLFTIAMVLIFVMASCQKEGVFNPKKKIDRVYYSFRSNAYGESTTTGKYVKEVWDWDNNILKGIAFYDEDGDLQYTETYSYDKNKRLSEISWGSNSKYTMIYDGKHLSRIDYYSGSTLEEQIDITHDGNRISEMKITDFDSKAAAAPMSPTIFRFFLPNFDEQSAAKVLARINTAKATKSTETYTIKFEWDGKNIKKLTEEMGPYKSTINYTYDDMANPFKGLFDIDEFTFLEACSANNVVKETAIFEDEIEESSYSYVYDGKYPTSKTYSYDNGEEYSYSYTYYYEYK